MYKSQGYNSRNVYKMNTTHTQVTTFQIMIQKMTSIPEDFLVSPSSSFIPPTKVTTTLISNSQTYFFFWILYTWNHTKCTLLCLFFPSYCLRDSFTFVNVSVFLSFFLPSFLPSSIPLSHSFFHFFPPLSLLPLFFSLKEYSTDDKPTCSSIHFFYFLRMEYNCLMRLC